MRASHGKAVVAFRVHLSLTDALVQLGVGR
jgi:hypothetical protein